MYRLMLTLGAKTLAPPPPHYASKITVWYGQSMLQTKEVCVMKAWVCYRHMHCAGGRLTVDYGNP